jgi:hypothetical protein
MARPLLAVGLAFAAGTLLARAACYGSVWWNAETVRWSFFGPFEPWESQRHVVFTRDYSELADWDRAEPLHYRAWDNRRVFAFAALMGIAVAGCMALTGATAPPTQLSRNRFSLGLIAFFLTGLLTPFGWALWS